MTLFITDKSQSILPSIYDEFGSDYTDYTTDDIPPFTSNIHHIVNDVSVRQFQEWKTAHEIFIFHNNEWRSTLYEDKTYTLYSNPRVKQEGVYYVPPGVYRLDVTITGRHDRMEVIGGGYIDHDGSSLEFDSRNDTNGEVTYSGVSVTPYTHIKYTMERSSIMVGTRSLTIKQLPKILEAVV